MKEYAIENNKPVDLEDLKAEYMSDKDYFKAHNSLVMACHDVFIHYQGGILLVTRDNHPAKDELWPVGGRILRGFPTEESLKLRTKQECNLELTDITELGTIRWFGSTCPFNHRNGTDSLAVVYEAKGSGDLKLDDLHKKPLILKPEMYTPEFREVIHPYVRDHLDLIIEKELVKN